MTGTGFRSSVLVCSKVPLIIAVTFTVVCFFIVGLSLYSDPWNTGRSCALTLTGVPVYYLTVQRFHLPHRWRHFFSKFLKQLSANAVLSEMFPLWETVEWFRLCWIFPDKCCKKLQILLEVAQQEVQTYWRTPEKRFPPTEPQVYNFFCWKSLKGWNWRTYRLP